MSNINQMAESKLGIKSQIDDGIRKFLIKEGFRWSPATDVLSFNRLNFEEKIQVVIAGQGTMYLTYRKDANSRTIGKWYNFTYDTFDEVYNTVLDDMQIINYEDPQFDLSQNKGAKK